MLEAYHEKRRRRLLLFIIVCAGMVFGYSLFNKDETTTIPPKQASADGSANGGEVSGSIGSEPTDKPSGGTPTDGQPIATDKPNSSNNGNGGKGSGTGKAEQTEDGMVVIAKPEDIAVLVNKQHKLPEEYNPTDLVYPDVRFIFAEKIEKRLMRQDAATALEKLFAAAEEDNIQLAVYPLIARIRRKQRSLIAM